MLCDASAASVLKDTPGGFNGLSSPIAATKVWISHLIPLDPVAGNTELYAVASHTVPARYLAGAAGAAGAAGRAGAP